MVGITGVQSSVLTFAENKKDKSVFLSSEKSQSSIGSTDEQVILKEITDLGSKYGLKVDYIKKTSVSNKNVYEHRDNNCLSFDSVSDFEKFVYELKNHGVITGKLSLNSNVNNTSGTKNVSIWSPFSGWGMTGLACWQNTTYEYECENRGNGLEFVSANISSSYISGLNICSWIQDGSSCNIVSQSRANDRVEGTVCGHYHLGIKIGDFDIGATIPDVWSTCLWIE